MIAIVVAVVAIVVESVGDRNELESIVEELDDNIEFFVSLFALSLLVVIIIGESLVVVGNKFVDDVVVDAVANEDVVKLFAVDMVDVVGAGVGNGVGNGVGRGVGAGVGML